eukprot:8768409-Alexandrium_andersonii.AAC.1
MPFLGRTNGLLPKPRELGSAPLHRADPPSLLVSEVAAGLRLEPWCPRAPAESSLGSRVAPRNVFGPPATQDPVPPRRI